MRLNIRREQIDVMAAVSVANFERAIARDLLSNYGDSIVRLPEGGEFLVTDLPQETLERLVRVGIDKARRFEVTRQSSIAGFVAMMFSSAPNFDANRLCEVLLSDEEKTPDERADEIPNVLSEKNWDTIRHDYDPQAWILPEVARPETASPEGSGADEIEKAADPMAKTVTGKTLARFAKKPKETVDLQPQVPAGEPGVDVNTVKIDREK